MANGLQRRITRSSPSPSAYLAHRGYRYYRSTTISDASLYGKRATTLRRDGPSCKERTECINIMCPSRFTRGIQRARESDNTGMAGIDIADSTADNHAGWSKRATFVSRPSNAHETISLMSRPCTSVCVSCIQRVYAAFFLGENARRVY